jgi:3-deoxy-7-phosphoheptulonate synthase
VPYPDRGALEAASRELAMLPPLVTSWEVGRLRERIAEAAAGRAFLLHAGDCAETFTDCEPGVIVAKLKVMLRMSLVLGDSLGVPIVRVGRLAGQYAKPRSEPTESRAGRTLPSYFGDMVNAAPFTPRGRTPDPRLLIKAHQHAAMTLNFVRSLISCGFADADHADLWSPRPEQLPAGLRERYGRIAAAARANPPRREDHEFFTSHEALHLWYDSAMTRTVPHAPGWYNLSTHLPWIGERTRGPDGAHVEYARGLRNPVGVKLSANATPADVLALADLLNPANEPGKLLFITRIGAARAARALPPLLAAARDGGVACAWCCDPMHANTLTTAGGLKTRRVDDIIAEVRATVAAHKAQGTTLAGLHLEIAGENVTECLGGSDGPAENDLGNNYASACDPRLNPAQAMQVVSHAGDALRGEPARRPDEDG